MYALTVPAPEENALPVTMLAYRREKWDKKLLNPEINAYKPRYPNKGSGVTKEP